MLDGKKIALLAISDLGPAAGPQIATASERGRLATAIASARSRADLVACLVHWGIENTDPVTDEQRELARWLVNRGVDIVVGSHPHCVQPLDFYHGCPIAYSLGNLVFDGAPTIASWNHSALPKVTLDDNGKVFFHFLGSARDRRRSSSRGHGLGKQRPELCELASRNALIPCNPAR